MKQLDMEKLQKRISRYVDLQTALENISPVDWPSEVVEGKKKVAVTKAKRRNEKYIRLEWEEESL